MLTPPGGQPPFQRGGMGDHGAGMTLAAAICAGLVARDRTGEGQLVHTSLLRHGMYTISFDLNTALRFGVPLAVAKREAMTNPAINCYRDSDGRWFWLIGLEGDRHWPDLCRAVEHPEWIDDERFATADARREHIGELIELLDATFATRTRSEWGTALDREDMWWAPVQIDRRGPRRRAGLGRERLRRGAGRRRERRRWSTHRSTTAGTPSARRARCRPSSASTPTRSSPSSARRLRGRPAPGRRRGAVSTVPGPNQGPRELPSGRRREGCVPRLQTAFVAAVVLVGTISLAPAVPASAAERGRQHPESAQPPDPYFPDLGNRGYDVQHYDLGLSYDPASKRLTGDTTITATATERLRRFNLDLAGLHVSSIEVDGAPARFHHTGDELIVRPRRAIAPAAPFTVRVRYSGRTGPGRDPRHPTPRTVGSRRTTVR